MTRLRARALTVMLATAGALVSTAPAQAAVPGDLVITPTAAASPTPSASGDSPEPSPSAPTAPPSPQAPARPVDMRVYAIGDSVMLGAKACLEKLGYVVNAAGSRRPSAVAEELGLRRTKLPRRVVVHTGTNGGATVTDLENIVQAIGPGHEITFVTVQLPDHSKYSFEARTNAYIKSVAARFPFVHVADWHAWSDEHTGLTYADGIHLPPAGCRAFAYVISSTLHHTLADTNHKDDLN